jgi:hypothetical protein
MDNGLVASSFLDFFSFLAMFFEPPFFGLPYWADARVYAHRVPMAPANGTSAISFGSFSINQRCGADRKRESRRMLSSSTGVEISNDFLTS